MNVGACAICARQQRVKVERFSLIRTVALEDGRRSSRGVGSIALCERCWREVAAPFRYRQPGGRDVRSAARKRVLERLGAAV